MNTLYLAWAHIRWYRWRSAVLVFAIAVVLAVPATIDRLLAAAEARLAARAESTPLILGARGSRLDLVMNALYFAEDQPELISMREAEAVRDSGLAIPIPLNVRFQAREAPIVGTTPEYFELRGLALAEGRGLALLGEAVLGAAVARRLGLGPGGAIVSTPANLFDLAGVYPLKMPVVGVLAPTGTPDDKAVFVDLKTSWIIAGIGHGHDDVVPESPGTGDTAAPKAAYVQYQEVTPENFGSFHFHGDPAAFPLTAVIAAPPDARSGMILRGRYLDESERAQIVVPDRVIREMLARVFEIKSALDAAIGLVALAAFVGVSLAVFLSLQLRQREMNTAYRLGCRRSMVIRLVSAEVVLLLGAACAAAAGLVLLAAGFADSAAAWLLTSAVPAA